MAFCFNKALRLRYINIDIDIAFQVLGCFVYPLFLGF